MTATWRIADFYIQVTEMEELLPVFVHSYSAGRREGETVAEGCSKERWQGRVSHSCQGDDQVKEVGQQNTLGKGAAEVCRVQHESTAWLVLSQTATTNWNSPTLLVKVWSHDPCRNQLKPRQAGWTDTPSFPQNMMLLLSIIVRMVKCDRSWF